MSCIANSSIRYIVFGGLINPIAEHVGISFSKDIERPLMVCPILNMGMICCDGESYGLVVHMSLDFYIPNRKKTRVSVKRM